MSNCSILTPEGASLVESLLDDAILSALSEKDFKLKIKKLYQDTIKDTLDNIEDVNKAFLDILNNSISRFVDITTWASDYAGNNTLLESIYLLHQTEDNKDLEGDKTEINKEDTKDGTFLYRVYGTSSSLARTDLEQRFASLLGQSVFFDPETLSEIRTQEDFNQAIIYKLNEVYQKFLENYEGPFKSEFPKGNLFDNIHGIEYKLSKIEEFKNVNPFTLDRWFNGKTAQDKKSIEAFLNYFILRNFDKLIQLNYSDVVSINSSFKIGKLDFLPTDGKYSVVVGNKHLHLGWSSDDDLSDVIKESSGLIRLLFNSLEKRGLDGKVLGNLSFNEVTAFWTRLRSKLYHKNANVQVYNEAPYLSLELKNYLSKKVDIGGGMIQTVPRFTLAELIREIPNSPLAIEALFTIMYNETDSKRYNVGMYHSDKIILKSLYELVYHKNSVIYKTYHKPLPTDVVSFNDLPKNYLNFIEQFFTSTTHIPMTLLLVTETGAYQLNPISAANLRNQVARLRGNFNITFSASLDATNGKKKEFNTFVIDDSNFKRAGEKDSKLIIKIKGTNKYLTITPNLEVKYSDGDIDLSLDRSLSNFIQEVLNINSNNFSETVLSLFKSLGINDEDLINLAGEILYNRTVSSRILKSDNMYQAKKLAKIYYADTLGEVLSMLKNKLEVNSFFSSTNYNTAILLTQALDLLNGINRDTIGKGADGNLVNSRTTQQLAASAAELIQRSINNPSSAVRELKSLKAYRGVEYARDLSGRGFNKKVTEFSPAEHMAFDFIYDFATKYIDTDPKSKDKLVRILPLVISDKTRILKALIDLDEICPLYNKPYRELSTNQLYEVAKEEFGNFYQHTYNQIENDWTVLGSYASSITELNNYGSVEANNDVQFFIDVAKEVNIFNIREGFSNINTAIRLFKNETSNRIRININNYIDDKFSAIPVDENAIKVFNEFVEEWAKNHDCTFETAESVIKLAINQAKIGQSDLNQTALALEWEQFVSSKVNDRAKAAVNNFLNALQIEQQKFKVKELQDVQINLELINNINDLVNSKNNLGIINIIKSIGGIPSNLSVNIKTYIANIINNPIEIIENSYYVKDKLEFRPNVALLEELYRWGKITKDNLRRFGLTDALIDSSRGTYKEFFKLKNLLCLSDTLLDGTTITLAGQYGTEIKDKNILKLKQYLNEEGQRDGSGDWVTSGHSIILGKIKYQDYDENGNLVDKFLRIKNAQSLTSISLLDFAVMHYSRVDPSFNFDSIYDYLEHPSFSFLTLEKIINTYFKHLDKALFSEEEAALQKVEVINKLTDRHNKRIERYKDIINLAKQEGNLERAQRYEGYILDAKNRFEEKLNNINEHYEDLAEKRNNLKENGVKPPKSGRKVTILVNPLLEKFNTFSYIFGLQFTNATVGSYINHPGKKLANLKEFCSKATSQQVKRNVSESAAKHAFRLNLFDGLSSSVRSAIVTNTQDLVSTISGEIAEVFDYDGALFTNGATNYYENNSLKGDSVGVDKKLFIHDYTDKTGTGKIIKCAGFAVTNYRIRNSFLWRDLNYKSLVGDESVLTPIIVNGGIDISKAFTGAKMEYGSIIYKKVCPTRGEFGVHDYLPIYDIEGNEINNIGHIIEVASIDGFDNGMVMFTINDYTTNQVQQVKAQIKNAYDLWLFFGGAYSMDKVTSTEYNENSFKQVAFAGNWLGTNVNGKLVQCLKESMIHYMPSVECTKQGASNINDITLFKHKENKLSTFMLNLYDAGVLLNAEHESDDSVLSMMTLVVNALGARGYTAEEAREVYAALNSLTQLTLSNYLDSLADKHKDLVKSRQKLETFISDVLWKVLKSQSKNVNSDNLADCLLQQATELIREKGKVDFLSIREVIPIDDPMFLRSLTSKISSILVSTSIKMKFPGTMDVLVPSNGFFTLYGNKMLGQYEEGVDNLPDEALNDVSEIKIGRTYHLIITKFDGTTIDKTIKVSTPKEYYYIKRYIKENTIDGLLNPSVQLFEVVNAGRELAGYNLTFKAYKKDENGNLIYEKSFNMWDLDSVKAAFITGNQLQVTQTLLDALNALNPNNSNNVTVQIDGEDLQVNKESIKVEPYEIIMSMLYKSQFGLRNGDDVQTIVSDRKFFLRRILEQRGSKLANEQFDIEIKTIDGNHKYLICDNNIPNGFTELDNIQEDEQGKRWYCDSKGRPVFQINYERDAEGNLTYSDVIYSNGSTLLIKTNDPTFYIDSSTVGLNISPKITEKSDDEINNIITNLRTSESRFVKGFVEQYDEFVSDSKNVSDKLRSFIETNDQRWEEVSKQLEEALNNNDEAKLSEILTLKEANRIHKKALQIHTSFIKSLDVLAARIPAQCMLSFMAMKVVGFDESGLNSAYVSNHQIYLLGSDFDIDKVSLLGFKFRDGMFLKWSPYMNLNDEELLKASEQLPFPTGKETKVLEETNEELVNQINALIGSKYDKNYIINLANVLKQIEQFGGIPSGLSKDVQTEILEKVNKHNLYIADRNNFDKKNPLLKLIPKNIDVKGALINFVSTLMHNISKNPVNQKQATASVDSASEQGPKERIKAYSEGLDYTERLKNVDPGSVTSLYRTMALTLGGKSNTGIVASSLKVFEGYLQYVYDILNNGTPEQMLKLMVGREICGKKVELLANAFQQNIREDTPQEVIDALNAWKENPTDFYLMFSAFLSFATDNAKDPRLPIINAEQKMIGLYLAGFTLGIDIDVLIPLLTSKSALKMVQLTRSNSFNQQEGLFDIEAVINYINHPNILNIAPPMNSKVKEFLLDMWKNDPNVTSSEFSATGYVNNLLGTKGGRITLLKRLNSAIENKNTKDSDILSLRRFRDKIKTYSDLQDSIRNEEIEIPNPDGVGTISIKVFPEITKLELMHKEMLNFSKIARLNQGLPNTVDDLINWLRSFESIISKRINQGDMLDSEQSKEAKKALEALNERTLHIPKNAENRSELLHQVNLKAFVENEYYRKEIINIYESLKFAVNIFAAADDLLHYAGYQKVVGALVTTLEGASATWHLANHISSTIDPDKDSTNAIINWVNSSTITEFLSSLNKEFSIVTKGNPHFIKSVGNNFKLDLKLSEPSEESNIVLGTIEGNATFKYIVENIVIPRLKKSYKNNDLLKDLTITETDKTIDRNSFTKLTTVTKLIPSNDFERLIINKYKLGLNYIKDAEIPEFAIFDLNGNKLGNLNFLDMLFLYNLIVNENKSGESNLTVLFQDFVFSSNSQSNIINSYFEFRKMQEPYLVSKISSLTGLDIDSYRQSTAKLFKFPISERDRSKNKYILVKDNTNKVVLCERISDNKEEFIDDENYNDLYSQNDINLDDSSDEYLAQEAEDVEEFEGYSSSEQFRDTVEENGYRIRGTITSLIYSAAPTSSSLRSLIEEMHIPIELIESGQIDPKVLTDVKQNPCS